MLLMLDLRIQQHFIDSADLQYQAAETLAKPLDAGVQALMACVTSLSLIHISEPTRRS